MGFDGFIWDSTGFHGVILGHIGNKKGPFTGLIKLYESKGVV